MSAAHIIALAPAIYHARLVSLRLSICGIAYILIYMLVFGASAPDGPDNSPVQGLYRVLGMLIFVSFMFWLLSQKYIEQKVTDRYQIFRILLKIWENAAAVFLLVLILAFAGLVSVTQAIA